MLKRVVIMDFRVGLKWCDCNVVNNESDSVFAGRLAVTFINSTDATAENKLFQNLVHCLPRIFFKHYWDTTYMKYVSKSSQKNYTAFTLQVTQQALLFCRIPVNCCKLLSTEMEIVQKKKKHIKFTAHTEMTFVRSSIYC